jgi:sugar phosphate isomerase/epimerase
VGEGVIDFRPIFEASEAQGAEWYIVEQDRCARPSLESARISLENLKRWGKA